MTPHLITGHLAIEKGHECRYGYVVPSRCVLPSKMPTPPPLLLRKRPKTTTTCDGFAEVIADAVRRGECPAGWPKFAPSKYDRQLRTKADMCRCIFPELAGDEQAASSPAAASLAAAAAVAVAAGQELVPLEVLASPKAHHRMRARLGVEGPSRRTQCATRRRRAGGWSRCPSPARVLGRHASGAAALKRHEVLREHLTVSTSSACATAWSEAQGAREVVACLIYARASRTRRPGWPRLGRSAPHQRRRAATAGGRGQ